MRQVAKLLESYRQFHSEVHSQLIAGFVKIVFNRLGKVSFVELSSLSSALNLPRFFGNAIGLLWIGEAG